MPTGYFYFDPQDPIYGDHFPGNAVVPGSLIIHAFMLAAERLGDGSPCRSASGFRFKRFVSPGRYVYRIENEPGGRMACFLYHHDQVVVKGTL